MLFIVAFEYPLLPLNKLLRNPMADQGLMKTLLFLGECNHYFCSFIDCFDCQSGSKNQNPTHTDFMKVLITGADGMLGSNLTRLLLRRGHSVSAMIHPASHSSTLNGLPLSVFHGDILSPETLRHAVEGHDALIHAAASTSVWPSRSAMVRRVNVEGTQNVIDSVLESGIKRMVYIGSASSVNSGESSPDKNAFPGARYRLDYIDTKFEALNLVMNAVKTRDLPALAVLPTYMIGPYDTLPGSGKMILAIAQGRLKFYTSGGRNFVHVNDVATAVANSLEMGRTGKCYIAGNENLSYRDFFRKVSVAVGKPEPSIRVPGWAVKFIGMLGSLSGEITRREPLLTYPMARISCDLQYVTTDDAFGELAMPQTSIDTAIRECYEWFLTNGYLKN